MSGPADILAASRRGLERLPPVLQAMLDGLDEATSRTRPAPAEWSPVEILCHLRDEEIEDFGGRVRAVLDGRETVAPIDPERWVEDRRYREESMSVVLTELCARRRASLAFLAGVDPDRLGGSVVLKDGSRVSGLDLVAAWATHDQLHLHQLAGTLARLWADRCSPLRVQYAGPIPYPPREA